MAKAKKLTLNYPVPQSDANLETAVHELGAVRRDLGRAELAMNDELAAVRKLHEAAAEPMKERSKTLLLGVEAYCTANRSRLTGNDRVKFARLATGQVSWRNRPPKVSLRGGADAVVETLRALGLSKFIRTKEEPNKEAMMAEPEVARSVAGVNIASEGEDFIVEPFEEQMSEGAAA